jgi:hypothetical protein
VTLRIVPGGASWSLHYGRRRRDWRSKGWYVKSSDALVAARLESLGGYCGVDPFEAELQQPVVDYHAGRGRLSYRVGVVDGKTTCLTVEQFRAQLDHLQELAGLNRRANPVQSAPGSPFDTPRGRTPVVGSSRAR